MKIRITFDLQDWQREAINAYYGEDGMADYSTCKNWIENMVGADIESCIPEEEPNYG